jgi:hypothetical protein
MKIETYGYIAGGRLVLQNRGRFDQEIKKHPDADVILVVKNRGKRTTKQNNWYRGVICQEIMFALMQLGNRIDNDGVHDWMKEKFNSIKVYLPNGQVDERADTTTELNKEEFSNYCEMIRMWAADVFGINIPDPEVQTEMKFDEEV